MDTLPETICIELNENEFLDSRLVRLEKGWNLRFICGTGLFGHSVRLTILETDKSYLFDELKDLNQLDQFVEFTCDNFGVFKYEYFLGNNEKPCGFGYFHVIPEWKIGANDSITLKLNSLSSITHLSKLLGPFNEWEDRLRVAHEAGYNAIHLTPIQELGESNSSYSIGDYLKLNPAFGDGYTFKDVKKFVDKMEHEWGVITIQDVVWNHAAKSSTWLKEHPECGYTCANSPHLRPAYVVDRLLQHFSKEISEGKWESQGIPALINSAEHLKSLKTILTNKIYPSIRMHEFFQANVGNLIKEFEKLARERGVEKEPRDDFLPLIQDPDFRRFGGTVDLELALKIFNRERPGAASEEDRVQQCTQSFANHLSALNKEAANQAWGHENCGINAILGHVHYERVADHGPKRGDVTLKHPLVTNYFLHPFETKTWEEDEKDAYDPENSKYLMACNGWVISDDPMKNFAEYPSMVYLRRELVCWGDCVKLNYGKKPEDCPFLWDYMKKYSEECAGIFHGFRIDNAHSTPIHVAEYLLHAARKIRPDLYVVAELFTGSESLDNVFVNRLGITSLVREASRAWDSHEQGRLVYRYGGDPVGAFRSKTVRPAPPAVAHAVFYDQTHDNQPPVKTRTAYDYVPTAAMTTISYCSSGSTRGYDEFVPFLVDVVHEDRVYSKWSDISNSPEKQGMIRARKLFNDLHANLSLTGYSEIFVDQINEDVVAVTRHNPLTHESVLVISHTCFKTFKWHANCKNIEIADEITDIVFEVKTIEIPEKENSEDHTENTLSGLPHFTVEIYEHVKLDKSGVVDIKDGQIHFKNFPSGCVIAFKITPKKSTVESCNKIENLVSNENLKNELKQALENLTLQKFNYILFSCEKEESSEFREGAYDIPGFGKLVYCGLQGIRPLIKKIQETDDLGHPLCGNLRGGNWLSEHIVKRLKRLPKLEKVAQIFEKALATLSDVPHFLRPCYFELIFSYLYEGVLEVAMSKVLLKEYLPENQLTAKLCLSSISFLTDITSALLPPLSKQVSSPVGAQPSHERPNSLAAGLPHFAEGIWRNWGRDTFIAVPGLCLLTGRFEDARNLILAFGGCLRHGLIPNLLAEGRSSRYNCRDAVWFWLSAILKYIELAPNGLEILEQPVLRLYTTDDAEYGNSKEEPLYETIYEALQRHFHGINYRERNAGSMIDEHMNDSGFNITAYIHQETGLIYGGNRWNCGTWMDKMGSSSRAGNKGQPATPRDGAAVELQGLALYVAESLDRLATQGHFRYKELENQDTGIKWTWKEWAGKIRQNFAEKFYVDEITEHKLVNKRGILKDSYESSEGYTDFQLRPNFCIALNAVPNIIDAEKAWSALKMAENFLMGKLGIKTLDPEDWAYNGYYNQADSENKQTACGWNYHQGPEWLWIAAVYLNAKIKIANILKQESENGAKIWEEALTEVKNYLLVYTRHIDSTPWSSLPELTNANGENCSGSCPAQAWSVGCLLEVMETLQFLVNAP
uniref:Glycogen debranching enzyme n=1 Tax=Acrobeloides nanus TaxID=290746 RepID=A0A914BV47_9BILA